MATSNAKYTTADKLLRMNDDQDYMKKCVAR